MNVKRHEFRGNRYDIRFAPPEVVAALATDEAKRTESDDPPRIDGLTDHPDTPFKAIYIAEGQSELDEMDACIHEAMHACIWDLAEDTVRESATDTARFLYRLGYRRVR